MNNIPNRYPLPSQVGVRPSAQLATGLLTQAFTWMFAGLLLTAGVAYLVQSNERLLSTAAGLFFPAVLLELGVVFAISLLIQRISAVVALGLFFVYAAVNGLTIGLIVSVYTSASVATAFVGAASMFGAAALYGAVTKRSLASFGGLLFMGLIGIIVASLLNLFLQNGPLSYVISIVGVGIFVGLTAYDTQRIARGDYAAGLGSMEKGAVFGALRLYLDFINLFLMLLRLMGNGRR